MEIKGPAGTPPVDIERPAVRPTAAGSATPQPTTSSPSAQAAATLRLSPALFQVGQLLEVIVAKIENNQNLLLMLQNPIVDDKGQRINLQLRAPMPFPVKEGQQLTVEVKAMQQGQPVLNIVRSNQPQIPVQVHLGEALANQRPLTPLLANLSVLQQPALQTMLQALPQPVRDQVQVLWRTLPDAAQIQKTQGLKQALLHSGPFLESQLARAEQPGARIFPAMDVRTGLLKLAAAIRSQLAQQAPTTQHGTSTTQGSTTSNPTLTPSPLLAATAKSTSTASTTTMTVTPGGEQVQQQKQLNPNVPQPQARAQATVNNLGTQQLMEELLQQTDAGLARITSHQLQTHSGDPLRPNWLMELPVKHEHGVDVFDLRIQREPDKESESGKPAKHQWTVMLAFDLEGMGPVRVQVSLINEEVSTFWWADKPDTVKLFHQHMDTLQNRLKASGLVINKMDCQHGIPDTEPVQKNVPYSTTIVDEKA